MVFLGILAAFYCFSPALAATVTTKATAIAGTSTTERSLILQSLASARARRWSVAENTIAHSHDPLGRKLYEWVYYTESAMPVDFGHVVAFIHQNPGWPRQGKLAIVAEKNMPVNLSSQEVVFWFSEHMPQTAKGMDRYLLALIGTGDQATAEQVLRDWWKTANLEPEQQAYVIQRYGNLLDQNSQVQRLNVLLSRRQTVNARAIAHLLGRGYPQLAEARLAFAAGQTNAFGLLAYVPVELRAEPGLLLDQLRWRLGQGNDFAALEILHNMPPADSIPNPDDWWTQRAILIRHLIANRQYESAYLLAKDHGVKSGAAFADGEFMAGWLALRFMNKPWEAFEHFEALYKVVTTPISRARAAYWAGRASDAMKYSDVARQWYQTAGQFQTTFYGQLAIGQLKDQYRPAQQMPPTKTPEGKQNFDRKELVRAAHFLDEANMNDETTDMLDTLAESVKTPEDYRLTAELAEALGHPQNAVRIAKRGLNKGILLMDQLYPTMLSRMRNVTIEWALAHALIRQESGFDVKATSSAGAQGLMQLMPGTAKHVAEKNKIPYRPDLVGTDPDYNIRLGSLYFKQVLDRFDGSYPLALAGYNAGPRRVDEWLVKYGDPRQGHIDIADWIELIPLSETRNYVQRVLEGVYIYRLKLRGVQKSFFSPASMALSSDHH